jgi:hypothetical protein
VVDFPLQNEVLIVKLEVLLDVLGRELTIDDVLSG